MLPLAEFETNLRRERQLEGIAKAKAAGVYRGRNPSIDQAQVEKLKAEGLGATEIAKRLNIGRASVYRVFVIASDCIGPPATKPARRRPMTDGPCMRFRQATRWIKAAVLLVHSNRSRVFSGSRPQRQKYETRRTWLRQCSPYP